MTTSNETPVFAVPDENLIPVNNYPKKMMEIPPSRMFLIKKSLKAFTDNHPGEKIFDASQGDGGASLPGVPQEILEKAASMQIEHGSAYDMPFGTDEYRKAVVEDYWKLDSASGITTANVLGTSGGRDALVKAYEAMMSLGHGRVGDVIAVSRVPWISYNWGPYGVGANVMWSPGDPNSGWAYTEDGIAECVKFAARSDRKIAGLIITNPDNPTGMTTSVERQVSLAKAAIANGIPFVLFDWMYHFVTDEKPMDLNQFIQNFTPEERKKLMFLDGLTKSLGASNIRNCHLIADESVIKSIVARASHAVIPTYYSLAVAMTAYRMGYDVASKSIIEPTNESRKVLEPLMKDAGLKYIIGKGYYAFINVGDFLRAKGWEDSEPLSQYLAEKFGVAIVPGAFFSPFGGDWIRFSYATPPVVTKGAFERLLTGLKSLL